MLTVTLAPSYPTVTDGSTTHAQLPVPWVPSNSWTSLQQLLDEFKQVGGAAAQLSAPCDICSRGTCTRTRQQLAKHQEFWDVMDELDAHVWVLEPSASDKSRAHRMRRIGLGGCSPSAQGSCWRDMTLLSFPSFSSRRQLCVTAGGGAA